MGYVHESSENYLSQIPINKEIKNKTYTKVGNFIFSGSIFTFIESIKAIVYSANQGIPIYVRIIDVNNDSKVIAENSIESTEPIILNLGNISNLPKNESVFEIQVKSSEKNKNVYIEVIDIIYS